MTTTTVHAEATVSHLEGRAWIRGADGSLRELHVGDHVREGETLVTAAASSVELSNADGAVVAIGEGREVLADATLLSQDSPTPQEAALTRPDTELDQVIQALNSGNDPLAELDAAAAGLTGGDGQDGHSFVQLLRISEGTDPLSLTSSSTSTASSATIQSLASTTTNLAPTAADTTISTQEDTPVTGSVSATDANGNTLSFSAGNAPQHGSVVVNSDGTFTYTPSANYNGADSFTVTVSDGQGGSTTSTVSVGVTAANDAPTTANVTVSTSEDTPISGTIVASDVDGDSLSFAKGSDPTHGSVVVNADGTFTYTPSANYNGADSFTVTVSDGQGGTTTSTVSVGITAVNDAPTTANVTVSTSEDTPISGTVVASDVDGDSLNFAKGSDPTHGSVVVNADGTFTYTPSANYNGADSFTVTVSDGQGGTTTSTVSVGITAVNDAPTTSVVTLAASPEDTAHTITAADLLGKAADTDGDALNVSGVSVDHGSVTANADGTWTYTPDTNFNGQVSFSYTITDNGTTNGITDPKSVAGSATLEVTPINDAAVIIPGSASLVETDAPLATSGTLAITDADSPATFQAQTSVAGSNGYGHFTVNTDGSWTYTADSAHNEFAAGKTYTDSITVQSADGTPSTITVEIAGTNDAAVITPVTVALTETDSVLSTGGTLAITDVDSPATFQAQSNVAGSNGYGHFTVNTDGSWTYTADSAHNEFAAGKTYTDSITVQSADGTPSTITVEIAGTNDAAVITPVTVALTETDSAADISTSGTLSITDVDSPATFQAQTSVAGSNGYGHFTVNTDGSWTYTADSAHNEFAAGKTYTDSITVQSADGTPSTITVEIAGTNDAAVITPVTVALTETDSVLSTGGTLAITDVDSPATFQAQSNVAGSNGYGHFTVNTDGSWTYTADSAHNEFAAGKTYTDSITVQSADGTPSTITVEIASTNDAAVITPVTVALTETDSAADISTSGTLSITDADSPATFQAQNSVAGSNGYGHFTVNTDGSWTYTADSAHNEFAAGKTYTDSITVQSADGTPSTITVEIAGTNDAAVITPVTVALTETDSAADISTSGTLSITDVDSPATFQAQTSVAGSNGYGHFTVNTDGSWTYTADSAHNEFAAGKTYTDSITVQSADGTPSTITVEIAGTNDAAVITPVTVALTETDSVLSTGGTLAITDVDSPATFQAQSNVAGSNGYGHFTVNTDGSWTYTADSAHNEFAAGKTYTDSITVQSADGTPSTITVEIASTNDAAVITPVTVALTETDSAADISTSGTLSITDADSPATFQAQNSVAGSNGYGHFTVNTDGSWTYTADSAHNEFAAGKTYTDSITVQSADGTPSTITVEIAGTNDAAVITPAVVSLTETDAPLSTSGTLAITDVDSPTTFQAQSNVAGSNGYGHFTVNTDGSWTYTADSAHNEFAAGKTYTDSITVQSADGTPSTITVEIAGTNDAAVITPAVVSLTETDAPLSTSGTLAITDVDSPTTFQAQSNVAGSNGYGHFTVNTDGSWTYTADSAHNEFAAGKTYTDSITVQSADGTPSTITVEIAGTNDAAVITPAVVSLTETDAPLSTSGTLAITDVDSPATFQAQSNVAGSNGYGHFTVNTDGSWTYTADSAHNEFAAGKTYTDSITVQSADGTPSTITVEIAGTNDAAVITPVTVALTETDSVLSTGGTLAITDADSPATFQAQTSVAGSNGYGHFTVNTDGSWTYTADSAHNEFEAGKTYTDSITVQSADGTPSTITVEIAGTNDAAVITPAVVSLTETDAPLSTSGTLAITDVDSPATFQAQSSVAGSNGYGHFTVNTDGSWTYTADSAHNEFAAGKTYTDSITVQSADGTPSTITVEIAGTNDAAVITGTDSATTKEDTAPNPVSGTLSVTDADAGEASFQVQSSTAGAHGTFSIDAAGHWTYTLNNADPGRTGSGRRQVPA